MLDLLHFAAMSRGPALHNALANLDQIAPQTRWSLITNPAVPIDIAIQVAAGRTEHAAALQRRGDIDADAWRTLVQTCPSPRYMLRGIPSAIAAAAAAPASWWDDLLDRHTTDLCEGLVADAEAVLTDRPHPTGRITRILRATATSHATVPAMLWDGARTLLWAHPDAAAQLRLDPTGNPIIDLAAVTAQVVTAATLPATVAALAQLGGSVPTDARHSWWSTADVADRLCWAVEDAIDGTSHRRQVVNVATGVAGDILPLTVPDLARWAATARPGRLNAAGELATGRMVQVALTDPAVRTRVAAAAGPTLAERLLAQHDLDVLHDLPIGRALAADKTAAQRFAERLDELDDDVRQIVLTLDRQHTANMSFNDLVAAATAAT